ncbi:MAG: dipeptidase PepE [Planctomycetes bacterium]|nr:dipeptidase PepE [Planctomycetota bacterium]
MSSRARLLLVSTSTTFGTGYLDHCAEAIAAHFAGARRVLFVPFALFDREAYAEKARARFEALGFGLDSLHRAADPARAVESAEALFIGGGNTFRLLRDLRRSALLEPIARRVRSGIPYLGTSAGSNVAGPTIRTTNDMPIVDPGGFEALGLVPFQLNPHYLDPDPSSKHMGETREKRLQEYLEENERPVVGLREGGWIECREEASYVLRGAPRARLFLRGREPFEVEPGTERAAWVRA